MKKRKTALLTVTAISLFLLLIAAGARIFTGRMVEVSEVENKLTAEVVPLNDTAFNYPYIDFLNLKNSTDKYARIYRPMFEETEYGHFVSKEYVPNENMVTHQQAANIFGEAIKYILGYTGLTTNPALIIFDGEYGSQEFPQIYSLYYIDVEKQFNISGNIDPVTGKITKLKSSDRINMTNKRTNHENLEEAVDNELFEKIVETTISNLQLLGYEESVETVSFLDITHSERYEEYNCYIATIKIADGTKCVFLYCSEDNDYFELARFEYNW